MAKFEKEEKLKIIAYAEDHSISDASKKFNVWPDTIKYWINSDLRNKIKQKTKSFYHNNIKTDRAKMIQRKEYQQSYRDMQKHLSYVYTKDQCIREIHNYKKSSPSYSSLPTRNRIIHTFQLHFFHKERELWRDKKVKSKLIKNRKQYLNKDEFSDREILRGFKISGIHMGYSHFSPLWFLKFIKDNNIQSAYDPCGGWGHRMIGAYLGDIKYIYNDKWDKTFDGCREISKFLGYECSIYNEDCTSFTPSDDYECIFTCPPYENIEIYNDETIDDFDLFLKNLFIHSIKPSVEHIGIVINKPYIHNIIDACPYKLKEIFELGTTNHSSHLNKDNSIKGEYLLHFTK